MNDQFQPVLHHLQQELAAIRSTGVSPAVVESVSVEVYGARMTLLELATITAPDPHTLLIQPWDKTILKQIEKALQESAYGVNPVVDGESVRLAFPPLTEEKRKEFVKMMREKLEDARVSVRKIREDILKGYKAQQKAAELSEDDYFRLEKDTQKVVDAANSTIKQMGEKKEIELTAV